MNSGEMTARDKMLGVQEFADRMKISVAAARQWAYTGKITSCKVAKFLLIPASEIDRLIAEGMRERQS